MAYLTKMFFSEAQLAEQSVHDPNLDGLNTATDGTKRKWQKRSKKAFHLVLSQCNAKSLYNIGPCKILASY